MFSIRYVNTFGFFLLFVSTGLTVFYSFRLLYFVLGGDLNFVPSYSMVETSYNMMIGTVDLCCILRCLVEIRYFFCLSVAAPLICEATYKSFKFFVHFFGEIVTSERFSGATVHNEFSVRERIAQMFRSDLQTAP